jgi:chromosome partitioning protein
MSAKIITVSNQKGGVGKTTTSVSLAHALARAGKQVILIDLDPQGQCATSLGMDPEQGTFYLLVISQTSQQEIAFVKKFVRETGRENLCLIPGNQATAQAQSNILEKPISYLKDAIKTFVKDGFDYIIFDTSPSVGGLQERAIWAADLVIIPTATEFASLEAVGNTLQTLHTLKNEKGWKGGLLGILPTFFDEKTRESRHSLADLKQNFEDKALPPIHAATLLRECWASGKTIFEYAPETRASQEYEVFANLVRKF